MAILKKTFNIVETTAVWLSRISIILLMLLVTADTILRYFISMPIPGAFEVSTEYLMPAIVFLSLSYAYAEGSHVKVEILSRFFKGLTETVVNIINSVGGLIFFVILLIASWDFAMNALEMNVVSTSVLAYPMAPALFLVPIGSFFIVIRFVITIVQQFYPIETSDENRTD